MGDRSHRQRMIGVRARVQGIIGGPADRLALSWLDSDAVVGRLRVGRGFAYQTFLVSQDDELLVDAIVAWTHTSGWNGS